jgi:exodeoxyribonuclease VII small subunit
MARIEFRNRTQKTGHERQLNRTAREQASHIHRFDLRGAMVIFEFAMSSKPKQGGAELNFEGAMDRLETIVSQMESGKLPLEELIVRYEEGMKLVKICQERLASAEQKIEIISRDHAGKPVVKDFEPSAEGKIDSETPEVKEATNDEVRLF